MEKKKDFINKYNNEETLKAYVGIFIILLSIPLVILNGFVIQTLWGWFISDFFGIKALTLPIAIGLAIFINLFKSKLEKGFETLKDYLATLFYMILNPVIALILGYIVHLFT